MAHELPKTWFSVEKETEEYHYIGLYLNINNKLIKNLTLVTTQKNKT